MSNLPAVVTILDLPLATTLSSAAMFEAVQTTAAGVPESVRVGVSQLMTSSLGALPTGGATGQVLGKSSGADFAAAWVDPSSFVAANATSGLAVTGSTSLALALASVAGLSVLGVASSAAAIPLPIAGTAGQVLRINDAGTGLAFGRVNLASSAAVTGVLPGANMSAVDLASPVAGGIQGILGVPHGGSGTSSFVPFGVLLGGTNATSVLQNAAPSTAGNILVDQGTAASPAFKVVSGDITITANGTVAIGSNVVSYAKIQAGTGLAVLGFATTASSNVTTFLASAANQVLQISTTGSTIGWGLPSQVLLNTISASNIATVADTTSFSASYRSFLVTFDNFCPSNATATLQLQVATTGTAFLSSGYVCQVPTLTSQANTVSVDTSTAVILLSGNRATTNVGNGTTYGVNGFMRVMNPASATAKKMWMGELSYLNGTAVSTGFMTVTPSGFQDINNAITGFQVSFTPGNIQTGTLKVYGLT